jgi:hypothetical protein
MAGIATLLVVALGAELALRKGLTPLKTLSQAASGALVLP